MKLIIIQHIEREGPSLYLKVAESFGIQCSIIRLYLGEDLPDLDKNQALLILGGPMGINKEDIDSFPWILDELEFIKKSIAINVPMIGVCLGAQLISYAAGGGISKLICHETGNPISEVGWSKVYLSNSLNKDIEILDRYFPMEVLHWHSDRIILPKEAILLASSSLCDEQMFLLNRNIFGIQFHVEIEEIDVMKWINEDFDYIRSNLGLNCFDLLIHQNQKFLEKTLSRRISFIEFLFNKLIHNYQINE